MNTRQQQLKVLVVDDEPGILALFKFLLSATGCTVLTAQDDAQALALAASHDCQVGFVDLHLKRRNRLDLVQMLRQMQPHMTVVPMLCHDSDELDHAVSALGMTNIHKPFEIHEVLQIIEQRCGAGHGSQSLS